MKTVFQTGILWLACIVLLGGTQWAAGQDWPQWLGPNRDGKVAGFTAPQTWPDTLTQKWKVTVGNGCATPALVGDKLYVFTREGDNEILRCLNAATGEEVWKEGYQVEAISGPDARQFSGPRSSPAVANGKIVTFGVTGILSCFNVTDHKLLWRKNDFSGTPRFHTSASPFILDGLCIAYVGGSNNGALVAYDLTSGEQKWSWDQDGPAYASPVAATVDGVKTIIALSDSHVIAVNASDGKLLWEVPFEVQRMAYNAATPIVDGQRVIYASQGGGTVAVKLSKDGDGLKAQPLWTNPDNAVQFNTPVLKNGLVFSISADNKFVCINAENGQTAWTNPAGGQRGFGSIVDAGAVLIGLTNGSKLSVFEANAEAYREVASYKVSDGQTTAYPVVSGNRIFVKDEDSVILWTL